MRITHVVGARPNFMKAAPVIAALERLGYFSQSLVHTGQHYDANMSDIFFRQLAMPQPDANLAVGSGTESAQTAQIMIGFEQGLLKQRPGMVLVYGDVNSTIAAAFVCAKRQIPVAHIEAGLRSFDRTMPEEINRLLTDQIADLLFTPSKDANDNLQREGIAKQKIHLVGNVMMDTLIRLLPGARIPEIPGIEAKYVLVTLHRPSNVDNPAALEKIMRALQGLSCQLQVIFPIHPRTRKRIAEFNLSPSENRRFLLLEPLGYLEFLALERDATVVLTDSGGVQEETTFLGVPCLTIRDNTERPVTVDTGTNILVGRNISRLQTEVDRILRGEGKKGGIPPLWDGKAGERIAEILAKHSG